MADDPYEEWVSFRLTRSQLETLDQAAKREGRTRSGWIRWKLEEFLTRSETGISTSTGRDGLPLD